MEKRNACLAAAVDVSANKDANALAREAADTLARTFLRPGQAARFRREGSTRSSGWRGRRSRHDSGFDKRFRRANVACEPDQLRLFFVSCDLEFGYELY
jgi:hypothetical protein